MRKSNAYFRKDFIQIVSLCVAAIFLIVGCKKHSLQYDDHMSDEYFKVSAGQPELVKQIAARIKRQDLEKPFIAKLVREEGNPLWNKSEVVTTEDETRVYIPLVLENTNYVNSYIFYRQTASSKSTDLVRGRTYDSYGFTPKAASHTIAGDLIRLNYLTFGRTKFFISDKRLFGMDKMPKVPSPYLLTYVPPNEKAGSERTATSSAAMSSSSAPLEADILTPTDESQIVPCMYLTISSNCGALMDSGNGECANHYVVFISTPCADPPTFPSNPGGPPIEGGGGGGDMPGLNVPFPQCPIGMSAEDCYLRSVPVTPLLDLGYDDLTTPVDSPEQPIIQNGIDVQDVYGFAPQRGKPRPIAHTRPRGNTEDMDFGTTGDISGINGSLIPLPDEDLFIKMSQLFSACTTFDNELNAVGNTMINKFRNRDGSPFDDPTLNQKVSQSAALINFAKQFGDELRSRLIAVNKNIDLISDFEIDRYRPVFNGLHNKFHGLQILINDTELTEVQLDDFTIDNDGNWNAVITITIHDHFGLDKNDAMTFQRYHNGFPSWWLLQHTRAYTPYETVVKVQKRIIGKL